MTAVEVPATATPTTSTSRGPVRAASSGPGGGRAVARQRFALTIAVTSFRWTPDGMRALLGIVRLRHGR